MKSRKIKISLKDRILKRDRGFALVAAITLMILLSLISVALMTLAASVSRSSGRGKLTEEARAQARLALQIAVGHLQTELGPDQRITALSGILSTESDEDSAQGVSNPYILGVWNSWDTWLNRNSKVSNSPITTTYDKGRASMFRRWLISSADDELLKRWNSVTGASRLGKGAVRDRTQILMLGQGTLGDQYRGKEVYAGLVEIDGAPRVSSAQKKGTKTQTAVSGQKRPQSGNKNYLAWWVSGENLKARINLPKSKRGNQNSVIDILQHTWDTPTPDANVIPGLTDFVNALPNPNTEDYDNKIQSVFTRGTLALLSPNAARAGANYFHDASFDASGLLTDVRFGGLKKDLNILLSNDSLNNTDYYEANDADVSIRPYTSEDANGSISNAARPLASWKQLYYWYNLWDPMPKTGQDQTAPLLWSGNRPKTIVASDPDNNNVTVMNNRYTYMRQPILLKMYVLLGFMLIYHGTYAPFDGLDGTMCGRPVFVWWNPYNVPMQVGDNKQSVGGMGFSYRVFPIQFANMCDSSRTAAGYSKRFGWTNWKSNPFAPTQGGYPGYIGFRDFANSFRERKDIPFFSLEPGEIKIFSNDLTYDIQNNSQLTLKKVDIAAPQDAYPYKHQFLGHEITYKSNPVEVGSVNVNLPVLWKYGSGMGGFDWMRRSDYEQSYIKLRVAGGVSTFSSGGGYENEKREAKRSMYQLFLKEGSSEDNINFAVGAGVMAENIQSKSEGSLQDGEGIQKYFPSFLNMNWIDKRPYDMILVESGDNNGINVTSALFDVMWSGLGEEADFGVPKNEGNPFWVSYYGVSAKGVYPPTDVNSRYPKNVDMRSKTWLYSSPVFWGSQMPTPTASLRQYHPYQFEVKQRRSYDFTQLDVISGDVLGQVVSESDTGAGNEEGTCYFGYRDEDMITHMITAELPLHPPFSLAGFSGARLTPGWYDDSKLKSQATAVGKRAKRMAYQSGVPAVGIGNAFADPMIPADKIHYNYVEHDPDLSDFWDHGMMNNDVLWDSWFTSSISNRPSNLGGSKVELREVASNFVSNALAQQNDVSKMLPNKRFKLNKGSQTENTITNDLTNVGDKNWEKSAKYLTMEGAFNVNSTSLPAWVAVLNSLKERKLLYADKLTGEPKVLNDSGGDTEIYFSRFAVASSDDTRDDKTLLRIEDGENKYRWSDLRKLRAATSPTGNSDIRNLARQIITQVKKRGPFLNMSEFVNRRLSSNQELGTVGALQAAIDAAGFNDAFKTNMTLDAFPQYNFPAASAGSVQTASPGYLIQSDVLAALGNTLTVRDDTFTVRAYGQVTNPSGTKIEARAWCEAVVQRTVDYVDPTNTPETPSIIVDPASGDLKDSDLTALNKAFGRKFKIISFRWLSPEEV